MKKFVSLLLAAMMLLSCPVAMASSTSWWNGSLDNDKDNSTLEKYGSAVSTETTDQAENEIKTEVWIKVADSAQIDVTVPLILLFSTNIDGGYAQEATNYKITNNNTRSNLAVTKVVFEDNANTNEAGEKMHLAQMSTAAITAENYYALTLTPALDNALATQGYANTVGVLDAIHGTFGTGSSDLFYLYKGVATNITADMKTGPLTFTTDTTDGIKVISVTYTVGVPNAYTTAVTGGTMPTSEGPGTPNSGSTQP